ncbi:MAG: cytochrome c [Pseudomonadales bacterium]
MNAKFVTTILSSLLLAGSTLLSVKAVAEDTSALVASCVACHGKDGVSPGGDWPSLAGQQREYLALQLKAFRDGGRKEPTMAAFVNGLSDDQIDSIARHYSELPMPGIAGSESPNNKGMRVRGNCMSCHGVEGKVVNLSWPNLAGQNKNYLLKQLMDFRNGTRHSPIMNVIANEYTEQQLKDVAEYYSQLAY